MFANWAPLRNLRVGTKITIAFAITFVSLVMVYAAGSFSTNQLLDSFEHYKQYAGTIDELRDADQQLVELTDYSNAAEKNGAAGQSVSSAAVRLKTINLSIKSIQRKIEAPYDTQLAHAYTLLMALEVQLQHHAELSTKGWELWNNTLTPANAALGTHLTALMSSSDGTRNSALSKLSGSLLSQTLQLRIQMANWVQAADISDGQVPALREIDTRLLIAQSDSDKLQSVAEDAPQKAYAAAIASDLKTFATSFQDMAKINAQTSMQLKPELLAVMDAGEGVGELHALAAEMEKQKLDNFRIIQRHARMWQEFSLALAVLAVIVGFITAMFVGFGVSAPLKHLCTAMLRLAQGDGDVEVPTVRSKDEIGRMAEAVQVFKLNMAETTRLRREQEGTQARAAEEKRLLTEELAANFEATVREVASMVATAATEMQVTAQSMTAVADQAQRQTNTVSNAASEAAGNVQTVASAAEELSSSIMEIGRQVSTATKLASRAAEIGRATDSSVQGLADLAQRIGEVVALISNIARQTNLLALNATIEAARAGDAGKGFAVVASEVKALAGQTAKATDEIRAQITAIQSQTQSAVEAIRGICSTINEVDEISTTIAHSVEQQTAATHEIARNVYQAAMGTEQVSTNIVGVSAAANMTGAAATQVLASSSELSSQAEKLRAEVDNFVTHLRAA